MATKKAVVRQIEGITFAAKSDSSPWVIMDGPQSFGGSDAGARPKELLLFALGGCTASDVTSILRKKRVPVDAFEVRVSATVREEHPQVFTDIHLEYVFTGSEIREPDVERAIELSSTKYCSVSAMLRGNVDISHSYVINRPSGIETGVEGSRVCDSLPPDCSERRPYVRARSRADPVPPLRGVPSTGTIRSVFAAFPPGGCNALADNCRDGLAAPHAAVARRFESGPSVRRRAPAQRSRDTPTAPMGRRRRPARRSAPVAAPTSRSAGMATGPSR